MNSTHLRGVAQGLNEICMENIHLRTQHNHLLLLLLLFSFPQKIMMFLYFGQDNLKLRLYLRWDKMEILKFKAGIERKVSGTIG